MPARGRQIVPARQPSNVAISEGTPLAVSAGLIINATFDRTITTDPNAAAIQSAINTAISNVQSMFSDAITVNITFSKTTGGLGHQPEYHNHKPRKSRFDRHV